MTHTSCCHSFQVTFCVCLRAVGGMCAGYGGHCCATGALPAARSNHAIISQCCGHHSAVLPHTFGYQHAELPRTKGQVCPPSQWDMTGSVAALNLHIRTLGGVSFYRIFLSFYCCSPRRSTCTSRYGNSVTNILSGTVVPRVFQAMFTSCPCKCCSESETPGRSPTCTTL